MKKLNLVIFLVACISGSAIAQVQFSIGLKGGLNLAKFDVSDISGSISNRTGFHGGAFALAKFTAFAIQPEVIFSQQGSEFNFSGQNLSSNFSYFNVPVLLKFYLPLGLNIQAGPQFGFLTSADGQVVGADGEIVDVSTDMYKNSDTSIALGLGWDLPMRLTVDFRYNLGISEIEDDARLTATKNQVFQLSVGYKLFKFGK
ncbi:MAG: PorT family protein [Cyclobacteriaceae bacterium]|nr:PorT family protein [Cyclobacteriaceae bacterium]